jgi:hypothetical protein
MRRNKVGQIPVQKRPFSIDGEMIRGPSRQLASILMKLKPVPYYTTLTEPCLRGEVALWVAIAEPKQSVPNNKGKIVHLIWNSTSGLSVELGFPR